MKTAVSWGSIASILQELHLHSLMGIFIGNHLFYSFHTVTMAGGDRIINKQGKASWHLQNLSILCIQ